METTLLPDKYRNQIHGVLHCYDRVIMAGSLQPFCYAHGMTNYLYQQQIRIFDYTQFAEPLRDEIRQNAERIATENGLTIEFIRKKNFRKEDRIRAILKQRGEQPGLVHIFSAMESCPSYQPWHDKNTGKTYLKATTSKCLHYYFYFIDAELGLCFLRVPTWCPFTLEFYFNGHAHLAARLKERGIAFEQRDNAFVNMADFEAANQLAQDLNVEHLHAKLDELARQYCPAATTLQHQYYWSIRQAEYATDVVFKRPAVLQAIFSALIYVLAVCVQPDDIATFLGQKLHGNYQGEIGNRFNKRQLGRRVKHVLGPVSIKTYDKFGLILRIETTVNDVSFFRHYREVIHRNGTRETKWAKMKKSIYSLAPLQEVLLAANQRYLAYLSEIETPELGVSLLNRVSQTQVENQHSHKGFNLLAEEDAAVCRALLRGEFAISGLTRKALRAIFPDKTDGQLSRLLKRLRVHGLIKKIGKHYKYYLTKLGRSVAALALKLRELVIIPALANVATA